jgi:chorismate mutase/prephenate dehydratase
MPLRDGPQFVPPAPDRGPVSSDLGSGMSTFSLILSRRNPTSTPPLAATKAMSSTPLDLKGLRRRLDEIDDRLQDLLIERAEVVSLVAATKRGSDKPAHQPAREAQIIRRLVGRHHGAFPVATLVRMWREMLAATVRLQSPFSVAVSAPGGRQECWDLARDHYGSNTPMRAYDTPREVIRAVSEGKASVGVLPMFRADESDPWWPELLLAAATAPRIIARLPFGSRGNTRADGADALALGQSEYQESGLDRTLLATECVVDVGRARILKLLSALGLVCTFFASFDNGKATVFEVDGFVPFGDARLDQFRAEMGGTLRRLAPLGGYAVPLPAMVSTARG